LAYLDVAPVSNSDFIVVRIRKAQD